MDRNLSILIVEPDPNYADLIKMALRNNAINNPVHLVANGQLALDYLCARGQFVDRQRYPFPSVIFTEIKLPLKSGLEILRWLRSHPACSVIPVIVLSASDLDSDIREVYHLGGNSYVIKPRTFAELQKQFRILYDYWAICAKPKIGEKC